VSLFLAKQKTKRTRLGPKDYTWLDTRINP